MTPEAKIKKQIKKCLELRKSDDYWTPVVVVGGVARGTPDILACVNGMFVGIEAKGRGKLTLLQALSLWRISQAGGLPLVVDSKNIHLLNDVLDLIHFDIDPRALVAERLEPPPGLTPMDLEFDKAADAWTLKVREAASDLERLTGGEDAGQG
jgi:hypothetical protein